MTDTNKTNALHKVTSGMVFLATQIIRSATTSMHLNSPSEHEVASSTKDDKERTQSNEIYVEVCVLDVQLFENVVALLKDARTLAILLTLKRFAVISIDCLQHTLE